jgi:hypothetical protein
MTGDAGGAARVEPLLERGRSAAVLNRTAVPDALERRHFVVAGTLARLESQLGIGADHSIDDAVTDEVLGRNGKALDGRQLVARVERRCVAGLAALRENLPAAVGRRIVRVWIRRSFSE